MDNWSFKQIQDSPVEQEDRKKETIYATDGDKCLAGVYYQMMGYKPDAPFPPESLRRMEVGEIVENNQVKHLKRAGLFLDAQSRIFDEEYNVSGRHDGLIISPTNCSDKAKGLIEEKKAIHTEITKLDSDWYKLLGEYNSGEISKQKYNELNSMLNTSKTDLYEQDKAINKVLLEPDPANQLMLLEFKSIVLTGFTWRKKDGKPMDSHVNQIMFYLWKLREQYPDILARVVYVDTSYQNILEFDVQYDETIINQLKQKWASINTALKEKKPPVAAPNIVRNPKGKWQVNWQADWCRWHSHCSGDPDWKNKAFDEVKELNKK